MMAGTPLLYHNESGLTKYAGYFVTLASCLGSMNCQTMKHNLPCALACALACDGSRSDTELWLISRH